MNLNVNRQPPGKRGNLGHEYTQEPEPQGRNVHQSRASEESSPQSEVTETLLWKGGLLRPSWKKPATHPSKAPCNCSCEIEVHTALFLPFVAFRKTLRPLFAQLVQRKVKYLPEILRER